MDGMDDVEDELFLAEVANLEAAGQREVELKRLIREKQTEIREAKKQRRQGGANFSVGCMSKREQNMLRTCVGTSSSGWRRGFFRGI